LPILLHETRRVQGQTRLVCATTRSYSCRNSSRNSPIRKAMGFGSGVGAPPAAGGYNTAAAHLRIDRDLLVNPKAPTSSKVAANPLLFEQRDERVKRHSLVSFVSHLWVAFTSFCNLTSIGAKLDQSGSNSAPAHQAPPVPQMLQHKDERRTGHIRGA
jgi:hypothetical protein